MMPIQINCAGFEAVLAGNGACGGLNFAPGQLCTGPAFHTKFVSINLVS